MTSRREVANEELHSAWLPIRCNQSSMETVPQVVHDFIALVGVKKFLLIWRWFRVIAEMVANPIHGIRIDKHGGAAVVRDLLNT